MDIDNDTDALDASFDLVARQDACETAIAELRDDVDEVKGRLDRMGRGSRAPLEGGRGGAEVKGFVDGYLRQGREIEVKAVQGTVPADGGYAVPREIDAAIARQLTLVSPIRQIAQVVQVGTAGYRKLMTTGGTASGWASETAARPETGTPKFEEIAPPSGDLYANPAASQAMLDDAAFDLEAWLASEIANEFGRAEGAAFVNGSGTNRPKGFLQQATSAQADAARAFGTLQFIASGNATGLGSTVELTLIELVHQLKSGHRQGASWVMNSKTLAAVRKLKTSDGAFLW
ncbi:MAG: phage major capsid protein, partial [Sphingopyxis sp.]|nr:phage major capsid protein [Sphingopyxis sp.]